MLTLLEVRCDCGTVLHPVGEIVHCHECLTQHRVVITRLASTSMSAWSGGAGVPTRIIPAETIALGHRLNESLVEAWVEDEAEARNK